MDKYYIYVYLDQEMGPTGYKHSEEARRKIGEALNTSREVKQKISESLISKRAPKSVE